MRFRVVTLTIDGWRRVAVVKLAEDDPSVWGVVAFYGSITEAQCAIYRMEEGRAALAVIEKEIA